MSPNTHTYFYTCTHFAISVAEAVSDGLARMNGSRSSQPESVSIVSVSEASASLSSLLGHRHFQQQQQQSREEKTGSAERGQESVPHMTRGGVEGGQKIKRVQRREEGVADVKQEVQVERVRRGRKLRCVTLSPVAEKPFGRRLKLSSCREGTCRK